MRYISSTITILLLLSQPFVFAQTKTTTDPSKPDAIRFPSVVQPVPPAPAPSPVAVPTLSADMMYVIEADIPVLLITAPPSMVTVTQSGPVTIRAKFIDGNGQYETKSYVGKTVYQIVANGKGKCHFFVVPLGLDTTNKDVRFRTVNVDNGQAPQPPPIPTPTDAFTKAIQAAWVADGSPPIVANLASTYKLSASIVNGSAKWSEVASKMHNAAAIAIGDVDDNGQPNTAANSKVLLNVRNAINAEIKSVLGTSEKTLDATTRTAIQAEFTKIQTALDTLR